MPKHTSCHKWIFNRVGSKTIFPKTCWNFDLGIGKMYMKRWGPTTFFLKNPRKLDVWMGKMGKKVYEKRGKQVFVLTNWRFIIKFFVYRQDFSCMILYVLVMILSSQCFTNDNNSKLNTYTDYRFDWPRYMTRAQCTCLHLVRVSLRAV